MILISTTSYSYISFGHSFDHYIKQLFLMSQACRTVIQRIEVQSRQRTYVFLLLFSASHRLFTTLSNSSFPRHISKTSSLLLFGIVHDLCFTYVLRCATFPMHGYVLMSLCSCYWYVSVFETIPVYDSRLHKTYTYKTWSMKITPGIRRHIFSWSCKRTRYTTRYEADVAGVHVRMYE